jgi:hypothetical protein
MKTIIISPEDAPRNEHVLPALYQAKKAKTIILFITPNKGTVFANPQEIAGIYVGREMNNLISCNLSDYWDRLPSGFEIKHVQE